MAIAHTPPNLVLLDLTMPELDGYAVIEQMHQSKKQAISILVTNAAEPEAIHQSVAPSEIDWT